MPVLCLVFCFWCCWMPILCRFFCFWCVMMPILCPFFCFWCCRVPILCRVSSNNCCWVPILCRVFPNNCCWVPILCPFFWFYRFFFPFPCKEKGCFSQHFPVKAGLLPPGFPWVFIILPWGLAFLRFIKQDISGQKKTKRAPVAAKTKYLAAGWIIWMCSQFRGTYPKFRNNEIS